MGAITLSELRSRYEDYRAAVLLLAQSYTSVAERRNALSVRDEFERDVRDGILDGLFIESENWE